VYTGYLRIHFASDNFIVGPGFALQWSGGGIDSDLCALCAAGKYKIGPGNAVCTDCMSNQYSTEVGAISNTCQACPANSVSASASTLCNCNAGWTGLNEGGQCVQCAAGKYKVQTGNSACAHCTAGKYSSGVGAQAENNCLVCQLGRSTGGLDARAECVACIPGKYADDWGSVECKLCSPGKYITLSGFTYPCHPCGENTYSSVWGADVSSVREPCPANTFSPHGSKEQTDCKCGAGWTGSAGSCTACVAGKYKIASGDGACMHCLAGQYATEVGATSNVCQSCPSNSDAAEASGSAAACTCNAGFSGVRGELCHSVLLQNTEQHDELLYRLP